MAQHFGVSSKGVPYLDQLHAAVKVSVQGQDQGPIGDGLLQLGHTDLVCGQEHDGGDAGCCTVG